MKPHPLATLAILAFVLAPKALSQRLPPAYFLRFQPRLSAPEHVDTTPKPALQKSGNRTWDGVIIGGFVGGVLGLWMSQLCGLSDQAGSCDGAALVGGLSGTTIGAVVGGMIGSGIRRPPRSKPSDSARLPAPTEERPAVPVRADSVLFPRARTHGTTGPALGAVMVGGTAALITTLGCALGRSGEHQSCARQGVMGGAIGAVGGGLLGVLLGTSSKSSDRSEEPR